MDSLHVRTGLDFVRSVRHPVGVREGEPVAEQQSKVRAHVARVCKGADHERTADFLGELVSAPSSGRPSPELRSARNDPTIMAEWLRRSFAEWRATECAAGPLLLVLEDLHWGDLPSVTYLGEALRALAKRPLMVLALGRPEVHDDFPSLWKGTAEIGLGGLTSRAAERLVRAALGDGVTADTVARIVERADGNAFYVEELVRRVSEGGGDSLPETVLALVQSRLEQLEPEARRVVRAASVFGEVFWRGAVAALLGGASEARDVDAWLRTVVEREVFSAGRESSFPGEREYRFQHGLLRDAAYAMLTESDRKTGHRLAGAWLEAAGEKDALTMADHLERGGVTSRAVDWGTLSRFQSASRHAPTAVSAAVSASAVWSTSTSERSHEYAVIESWNTTRSEPTRPGVRDRAAAKRPAEGAGTKR